MPTAQCCLLREKILARVSMTQNSNNDDKGDEKESQPGPNDQTASKKRPNVSQFFKLFFNDLRVAWEKSFKATNLESTDETSRNFLNRFFKTQMQNTRVFWTSLTVSSKRVLMGLATGYVILVFLLPDENSNNTELSLVELTEDAAFCSGYYEALVPGIAAQRHCAGSDLDSGVRCRRWALNEWVEIISLREDMAEHRNQFTGAYRMTRLRPPSQSPEIDLKCSEVSSVVMDQMNRKR